MEQVTLVAVVAVALFFDFTNGFHDTANSIATSVSTRALSPRKAVAMAAILNFVGAFISFKVAATVAKGIVNPDAITLKILLAGLVGAITWNLITWYLGLPSSSSHALIGGVMGSAIAAQGWSVVQWSGLWHNVLKPSLIAPFAGLAVAFVLMTVIVWLVAKRSPSKSRSWLSLRPALLGRLRRARPRHERRPEDDGHHRARARLLRAPERGLHAAADLGDRLCRPVDVRRHLRGRLAHHPHPRHADREDRRSAGIRSSDGLRVDPLDDRSLRLPGLDHPGDLGLGHGRQERRAACTPCAGA